MTRIALAVLLALLTLAAGTSAQAPKPGGQIVHGSVQEPDRMWGPVTGLTVSGEIGQLVNGHLIEINDKLDYVPSLAIEVPTVDNGGVSKDGLRYTFKLRRGVKWHDGQPFTAADVAFTHGVLMNPAMDVRGRVGWNKITKVETPDDATVVFQFSAWTRRSSIGWPRSASCPSTSSAALRPRTSRPTSGSARRWGSGRLSSRSGSRAATSCW